MSDATTRERRRARRIRWIVRVGGVALRMLATTWRIRQVNREPMQRLRDAKRPVIFTLWHGQLLPLLWHHRHEGITILVSEHGDGEIIARVAESLGYHTVRGSTTRGADRALLRMGRVAEAGGDLGFTPDGPRGPSHAFAPGVLIVSHRTGTHMVMLAAGVARCWRLKSWDSFMIPKPFARITVAYSDPVVVEAVTPRDAAAQRDQFAALLVATERAAHA